MHERSRHPRQRRDLLEQLARAREREARRVRVAEASAAVAVPALPEPGARIERRPRCLQEPRRDTFTGVHHRLAEPRADAGGRELLRDGVATVARAHVEDAGGAGRQELVQAQARARADGRLVVRRLERPDAAAQPVQERKVLRRAAHERLDQVDVRLDDPGHHVATRRVDDLAVPARLDPADLLDA